MGRRTEVYDHFISDQEKRQKWDATRKAKRATTKPLTLREAKEAARKIHGNSARLSWTRKTPRIYRVGYQDQDDKLIWEGVGSTLREAVQQMLANYGEENVRPTETETDRTS